MKKAILLTADKFEDMEVMYPLFRLWKPGHLPMASRPACFYERNYEIFQSVTHLNLLSTLTNMLFFVL